MPDAAVILDDAFRIQWFNSAARSMLGLSPGSRDHGRRITGRLEAPELALWLGGDPTGQPLELSLPGPPQRELELRLAPFGKNQYLLTGHDITELKRIQTVRRRGFNSLVQRVV